MKLTLSMRFMLEQFTRLEALGFTRAAAMQAANLTKQDCKDLNARVPLRNMVDMFKAAQTVLDAPNVGLHSGFKFRVATYAKTGNIYSYCLNIPQVIGTNSKYQKIAIDAGEISYEQSLDAQTGQIRHFMRFKPYMKDVETYRHVIDSIAGAYCTAYRWLSWSSGEDVLHVDLPYSAPDDVSEHEQLFRCPISFNQPYMRIEFSEKSIGHDISTYDAEKFARAEAQLMTILDSSDQWDGLKIAVKTTMRASLENGKIGTHIIAQRMDKTWSILRRQLIDANLSYRQLLEETRQEMFHECLEKGRSFSEIAQGLAYNDQAAFTKAFKRWYGVSPRQWKAAYQIAQTSRHNYKAATKTANDALC